MLPVSIARLWLKKKDTGLFTPGNDSVIIAGVATQALETIEDLPGVRCYAPLGGGSGVCGAFIVAKGIDPSIEV
ncbi:MAG: hypothetical protein Ct9H300mP11_04490 [Chloroflexota bacterium]|nr:MAG: hypothetical protein Ct9H300mP11_04490 [Chloroflexota bacterium]